MSLLLLKGKRLSLFIFKCIASTIVCRCRMSSININRAWNKVVTRTLGTHILCLVTRLMNSQQICVTSFSLFLPVSERDGTCCTCLSSPLLANSCLTYSEHRLTASPSPRIEANLSTERTMVVSACQTSSGYVLPRQLALKRKSGSAHRVSLTSLKMGSHLQREFISNSFFFCQKDTH